nr:hypothetical protein [Candidatus Cloacimonadota bacterium]
MTNFIRYLALLLILSFICVGYAQSFDIQAFADTTKYDWKDYRDRLSFREDLNFRQNKLQIYEMESLTIRENILKSAVIPGWGQFAASYNTKATIILSMELISVVGSIYYYDQAQRNYDKYKAATQIDEINHWWGKTQTPYHYSMLLLGLAGVIWGYNIYDVVMSTNEYNAELWEEILSRPVKTGLQITPSGLELRF